MKIEKHDPRIKESDRTQCAACGREVDKNWHFCPNCGSGALAHGFLRISRHQKAGGTKSMNNKGSLTPEQLEAEILETAIETYGADAQIIVAIEELSELTKSLTKYLRAGDTVSEETLESIHEEMSDVSIMLNQLELIFGDYSDWECFKLDKLAAKLGMEGIGNMEHPVIKNLERTGGPTGKEIEAPVCPLCGAETDTFMKTVAGEIVGCEQCVKPVDAWDYTE